VKFRAILFGFLLVSASAFAQNVPTSQLWGAGWNDITPNAASGFGLPAKTVDRRQYTEVVKFIVHPRTEVQRQPFPSQ
jgi:hypothetical protein